MPALFHIGGKMDSILWCFTLKNAMTAVLRFSCLTMEQVCSWQLYISLHTSCTKLNQIYYRMWFPQHNRIFNFNVWVGRYHVLVAEIIIHPLLKEDDTFPLCIFIQPSAFASSRSTENLWKCCICLSITLVWLMNMSVWMDFVEGPPSVCELQT